MKEFLTKLQHSLMAKLIITVGLILLTSISTWAIINIQSQRDKMRTQLVAGADRLGNTIVLGTRYAMMLNSRDDINQIINNIGKQREIEAIRIYNKDGTIKFSKGMQEVDTSTNIKAEACDICHRTDPPIVDLTTKERIRIIKSDEGHRKLGIIKPIFNDPGCSTGDCHFHPDDKKVLGALDVVVSLEKTDREILQFEKEVIGLALFVFILTGGMIFILFIKFVNRPISQLIEGTDRIARGQYSDKIQMDTNGEFGMLANSINEMGRSIGTKQVELNRQKDEYQRLFDHVPCLITVQDRDYKLIGYNKEFAENFNPDPGDYCYHAYKGLEGKCRKCPVEKTFNDGQSHYSEESGTGKDGRPTHWIVKTSPVKNDAGEVVAAMEISLDITHRKVLEQELKKSEAKYRAIFDNIPNPVLVMDQHSFEILDCNESVYTVYGFLRNEVVGRSFLDFFSEEERDHYAVRLMTASVLNRVRHLSKHGKNLYVTIRSSASEYPGGKVLLVTISDITKRLETEQQLIQASKMATLGEMATGVAHELNQPLSVIKTASSFFMKKVSKNETIQPEILNELSGEIDSHVDRATKIINHMRQFGRKSDINLEPVSVNDALKRASEIFSQQLKVRGINVAWEITGDLPPVMADAGRLEQVFINLLINARDAIEEKWEQYADTAGTGTIRLMSGLEDAAVVVRVCDSGEGVPPEIIDKVFEPFFTTKKVGKGTGLGLSISYGIIKECGGTIRVQPGEQEGTCFILTFPVAEP
ncbi:MAG: PAS domain S-box protein [Desulfobacterales bacterium]|nr:PAS domain S-box protein [Desulfobacterales bacterium]